MGMEHVTKYTIDMMPTKYKLSLDEHLAMFDGSVVDEYDFK